MSSIKTLLQNADPLRNDTRLDDSQRDRIRRTILAAAHGESSTTPARARFKLAAAAAVLGLGIALAGYQTWLRGTMPLAAQLRFEVRLAEDRPSPGLIVAQAGDSGRIVYLHPEVVVSNDDIAQALVSPDGADRYAISVSFLSSGAERMRTATAAHVGRPVAILIDGAVVLAPTVRAPTGDSAVITGDYTRDKAERIADGIGRR